MRLTLEKKMSKPSFKTSYGESLKSSETFCGCCGTFYKNPRKKPEVLENPYGISVYPGKQGVEVDTASNSVKHVDTPAGWVTVMVAKSWV